MARRITRFLAFLALTLVIGYALNTRFGTVPPLGAFLDPFRGFWQNAEQGLPQMDLSPQLPQLKEPVKVLYDNRLVPRIFAQNEADLYFMQGYVTASLRLWQMDMQSRAAAGRLAEVAGPAALNLDMEARRTGLKLGAERSLALSMRNPKSRMILHQYSAGVNAFIATLKPGNTPLEFKLLDYQPELWSPLKTILLLKYMANMLTGYEHDFENTNALKLFGYETFNTLFPDFPDTLLDPVIPVGTHFPKAEFKPDSPKVKEMAAALPDLITYPFSRPEPDYGSNNWAVSANRTESGKPILCNDPHLSLNLPSIWFEIQLSCPGINVYGASIPGAPGVISGFNDSIAWGVTNAAVDVRDWYSIRFRDSTRSHYLYDDQWLETRKRIEKYYVRGSEPIYDTIILTKHGPVAYDARYNKGPESVNLALRWTAHDPSNEVLTFYGLNSGKNYNDYLNALQYYHCPGQNFVFASARGDIAIRQQGKFVNRWKNQGRFILDGTRSNTEWQGFVPNRHNPSVLNPPQGWVSSANQHPTDQTYDYYYTGIFEHYRNRRINSQLQGMDKVKTEDMMRLQNDNFNLLASEALPFLLPHINAAGLSTAQQQILNELRGWVYFNEPDLPAPVYFEVFWDSFRDVLWDEFKSSRALALPDHFQTIRYLQKFPSSEFIDIRDTEHSETLDEIVLLALKETESKIRNWSVTNPSKDLTWANFKNTSATHLSRMKAFSVTGIQNGGNAGIVNATSSTKGPSWRMIVSPGAGTAFGVYPGGQSGNPGSPYYSNFIDYWSKGRYYPLILFNSEEQSSNVIFRQTAKP